MSPCRSRAHRWSIVALTLSGAGFVAGGFVFVAMAMIRSFAGGVSGGAVLTGMHVFLGFTAALLVTMASEAVTRRLERKRNEREPA